MNSPEGVKLGAPERGSIACPTSGPDHELLLPENLAYVTVDDQTMQHM